jgi:hypothetical protein
VNQVRVLKEKMPGADIALEAAEFGIESTSDDDGMGSTVRSLDGAKG